MRVQPYPNSAPALRPTLHSADGCPRHNDIDDDDILIARPGLQEIHSVARADAGLNAKLSQFFRDYARCVVTALPIAAADDEHVLALTFFA
jgi:hypothetical protein